MKQQLNSRSKVSILGKMLLQILNNLAAISIICLLVWGFMSQMLYRMQIEYNLNKPLLWLLIVELGLIIMSLTLSISCIIKIHKNKPHLPPKEDMSKILLHAIKNENFTYKNIDLDHILIYLDLLEKSNHIIKIGYKQDQMGGVIATKYKITKYGKKWLKKHNLIS